MSDHAKPNYGLSDRARAFRNWVQNPDAFPESCDGGDLGSPGAPSIWLFGLEPGWSQSDQDAEGEGGGIPASELEAYSVDLQLRWPFNYNAFKFLASLKGDAPENYVAFAQRERPFEKGSTGYFKGNLFPEACNSIGSWTAEHQTATGFETKLEYQDWMREVRFPIVRAWIEKCRPKLIVCSGLTHLQDFMTVTATPGVPDAHIFEVNGHKKRMHVAVTGIVPIVVIPHLSGGRNGLNSHQAIIEATRYIREVSSVYAG